MYCWLPHSQQACMLWWEQITHYSSLENDKPNIPSLDRREQIGLPVQCLVELPVPDTCVMCAGEHGYYI